MVACVQWRAGSEQQVVATGWWWTVDSCEVVFQVGRCRGAGGRRVGSGCLVVSEDVYVV